MPTGNIQKSKKIAINSSDVDTFSHPEAAHIGLLPCKPLLPQRTAYEEVRHKALSSPPTALERLLADRALAKMAEVLGRAGPTKTFGVETVIRQRLDRRMHEDLFRQGSPELVNAALAAVEPVGFARLGKVLSSGEPLLWVSVHYYLYSSILPVWLACLAARWLGYQMAILMNSGSDAAGAIPRERIQELVSHGIGEWMGGPNGAVRGPNETADVVFIDARYRLLAVRQLARHLTPRHAALVLPDAQLSAPGGKEGRWAIPLRIGHKTVHASGGAAWLAQKTGCAVAPVYIAPLGNRHRVVFGRPRRILAGSNARETVRGVLQGILRRTLLARPAAYDGWELWDQLDQRAEAMTIEVSLGFEDMH